VKTRTRIQVGILVLSSSWFGCHQTAAYQPSPGHLKGLTTVCFSVFVWREVPGAEALRDRLKCTVEELLINKAHLSVVDDMNQPFLKIVVSAGPLRCSDETILLIDTKIQFFERVILARDPSLPIWETGLLPVWSDAAFGTNMTTSAEQEVDRQVDWLMGLFCQAVVEMNKGSDPAAQTQRQLVGE